MNEHLVIEKTHPKSFFVKEQLKALIGDDLTYEGEPVTVLKMIRIGEESLSTIREEVYIAEVVRKKDLEENELPAITIGFGSTREEDE